MTKSPDAFRTISEVAEWLGTPAHVLRFWESKFTQVKPVKRAGGRRYYRPADMLLLGGIKKLLHHDGMTIKGAQKMLRSDGMKSVATLSQPLDVTANIADSTPPAPEAKPAKPTPAQAEPVVEQPMLMELEETPPPAAPQATSASDSAPQHTATAEPAQTAPLPLEDTQADSRAGTAKQQQLSALYGRLSALHNKMQAGIDSQPRT